MAELKYKTHRKKAKRRVSCEQELSFDDPEKIYRYLLLNGYREPRDIIKVHLINDLKNYYRVNWWNGDRIRKSQIYELVVKPDDNITLIEID